MIGRLLLVALLSTAARAATVAVHDAAELRAALAAAGPGTRIELAPGEYAGGIAAAGVAGTAERPVVVAAADAARPPVIRGGACGLQLSDAAHVVLEGLVFEGATGNGLNIDDGGTPETPAHHVVLRRLVVRDVGPHGNCDGLKLSGVDDVRIEDCTVLRWGTGGSAVDLVGCHRVTIAGCTFRHTAGMDGGSGVQAKGGSAGVVVRGCRFEDAGARAVNAGGSTGRAFFRPPLAAASAPFAEARDVRVVGNTFVGGGSAIAFVGVDGAVFRWNTVVHPGRWVARILQESRGDEFVPCRRGEVADNVVVFRSDAWREGGVNVGDATEPSTFVFRRNVWLCEDAPERTASLVRPPVAEVEPVHARGPLLRTPDDTRLRDEELARRAGAEACPPE